MKEKKELLLKTICLYVVAALLETIWALGSSYVVSIQLSS